MRRSLRILGLTATALLAVAVAPGEAAAQRFDVSGYLAGELRWFFEDPLRSEQFTGVQSSLAFSPEFRYRTRNRRHQFKVTPFVRLDARDDERTHFDFREAYWRTVTGDFEILAGVNTVFWGVTESRHLVDVINQNDFVEDVDQEDKLGQAMVQVGWSQDWGRLDGYLLFGFRETTLPGRDGRVAFPLPVTESAFFPDGKSDVDFALRYSHYIGEFDIGLHVFHGTNREPGVRVVPRPGGSGRPELFAQPVYRQITQFGVDAQWTRDAWLWKLEALVREGDGSTYGAAVFGFEYTLFQVFGASDLGLLSEFLYDGRDDDASLTFFDRDVFVGARLALNDVSDTTALAGAIIDVRDGSTAARLEIERRLTDSFKLELDGRFFLNVADDNSLAFLRQDSFANLRLSYNF